MIDFLQKSPSKNSTNSLSAYDSLKLTVGMNLSMSFGSYRPAKQLREFLLRERATELAYDAFEEHMPDTPLRFGEETDKIIIDWLNRAISPEVAALRIDKVISEFDECVFEQEKYSDASEIDGLFRQMAIALRDEIFIGEAPRINAWKAIREYRKFHNVSDESKEI